ncbi:hypothetical protein EXIGLDRAFT_729317, partial [Exidia glandulosa HHB12029]
MTEIQPSTQPQKPRSRLVRLPENAVIVYRAPKPLPKDCEDGVWTPAQYRIGGHVLTFEQAKDWVRRLGLLSPEKATNVNNGTAWLAIDGFVRKSKKFIVVLCDDHCKTNDPLDDGDLLFVSRLALFPQGYLGMSNYPRFKPDRRDVGARKFLASH